MRPRVITNPDRLPLLRGALAFVVLSVMTLLLLLLTARLGGNDLSYLMQPLAWLKHLDQDAAFDTLSNAAEVVAGVLAIAITVVAIVVELAATRYSHLITRLFVREPVNLIVLGLFVLTTLQCVWTAATLTPSAADALLPNAGFAITMALITGSVLCLLPYIYFVFTFLSPISIIDRIGRNGFKVVARARSQNVGSYQRKALESIDELQDVARGAIQQGDRSIAMAGVDALAGLLMAYQSIRASKPAAWFEVTAIVSSDADFVAMADESLEDIEQQGVWFELKIFRQFFALMGQSAIVARDVANLIAINTKRIAVELGVTRPELLAMCLRGFNSYLRTTIGARDPRTAYYVMNQYRLVAEHLLRLGVKDASLNERVLEIAGYLRYYGQLAHGMGISFLLEAASHDLVLLIERAVELESPTVDSLLDCLLELDQEIKEERQEESLLGVRRSQIQLATLFLQIGQDERARRIAQDLAEERIGRLEQLRDGLLADDRPYYWELTDRGANFAYLPLERRGQLTRLFEWIAEASAA